VLKVRLDTYLIEATEHCVAGVRRDRIDASKTVLSNHIYCFYDLLSSVRCARGIWVQASIVIVESSFPGSDRDVTNTLMIDIRSSVEADI
jgi:hypothetical protein